MFNEILEGGLNQVVIKRLGMQVGTPVPAVQPELATDLTLESDRPEWGWLKGEYRYGTRLQTVTPGAGTHAALVLENPANSGVLCVVERVFVSAFSQIGVSTASVGTLGSTGTGLRIDSREPLNGRVAWAERLILTASLQTASDHLATNADMNDVFILAPGSYLYIQNITAANAFTASARWRERPLLPGELG